MISSLWLDQPIRVRMAYLINYASVFNDVLSIDELRDKLGKSVSDAEFQSELNLLRSDGAIISDQASIGLKHLAQKLQSKSADREMVSYLLKSRSKWLRLLSYVPIISYIGICGSVAAGNPVETKDRELDIDVFVISKAQTFWLVYILLSFYKNFIFKNYKYPLCFNYMLDNSDLEVKNKNLYTATEIFNLITISGRKGFNQFLDANRWVNSYFPELAPEIAPKRYQPKLRNTLHHKFFFFLFNLLRCLKNKSFKPILSLSFKDHSANEVNINFKGTQDGGYQMMVLKKFKANMLQYLPMYYEEALFRQLFNDGQSKVIIDNEYDIHLIIKKPEDVKGWNNGFDKYGTAV